MNSPHNPSILSWVEELRRVAQAVHKEPRNPSSKRKQLFYFLHWAQDRQVIVRLRRGNSPDTAENWDALDKALLKPPAFVDTEDLAIFRWLRTERHYNDNLGFEGFLLSHKHGAETLAKMAHTERLYAHDFTPLYWQEARSGTVFWRINGDGQQIPDIQATPDASFVIAVQPPCYVDLKNASLGHLELSGNPVIISSLLSLPPLSEKDAELVSGVLAELAPELPVPSENASAQLRCIEVTPQPVLRLNTRQAFSFRQWRDYQWRGEEFIDTAEPFFRYQQAEFAPDDPHIFAELPSGETVRILRRSAEEEAWLKMLTPLSLQKFPPFLFHGKYPNHCYGLANEDAWQDFMQDTLAYLQEQGWHIEYAAEFRHHALTVEAWEADLVASDNGWFNLDMGIIVNGERLPLAPLLATLFQRDERWLKVHELKHIDDNEEIRLLTPDQRRIRVPAGRIKPLAATLIDLFDGFHGGNTLRVSRFDAPRLTELSNLQRWQFKGETDVFALATRLQAAQRIGMIAPPRGLKLELRQYQLEGLAWLQFLREHALSGILADDMGLGKTAQTLAHLLFEKESGRLDRPALIVLPTSLIFNWKNEALRFAPNLNILSLHGADRKKHFADIPQHDVILTTYPLLWRDAEELLPHEYHLLILDEAQTVKNARSQGAETVRKVKARHRLCLTGTPLENHLGELWSQFDFLLPGFLDTHKRFTRYWRNPIEKQGDTVRQGLLSARIRPFILRRKKEDVAQELPPKTVIIRKIELSGGQRDLYETVRTAMDSVVREEVANKGFARSQIVILDALLKLRQVCCDPRLLKAESAKRTKEHAKLDFLMTMLPELVDEGRRILIFSQFTKMLALIEAELNALKLNYVILTGDTQDRETPVRRFQQGEVPIFLISLKAGGVGLNLTAADTVIHYDPWWNPAAENQATDRAHRIGQDKAVFVYKLIVEGSIEEKILTLQERKASLAEGILAIDQHVELKFGEDDISALFAPLPN